MAAERLRKIKEKPIIDERIPHPYREVVAELRAMRELLEEIKEKLPVVVPPAAPAPPIVVRPPPAPPVPAIALPKEEFRKIYEEALQKYEALRLADDLHVETIDLGVDRTAAKDITEFPKLTGIALTIFKCTGTVDIYINKKDDEHKFTVDVVEPPGFLLDWFKVKTIFVGNAAQTGRELIIIAWKVTG